MTLYIIHIPYLTYYRNHIQQFWELEEYGKEGKPSSGKMIGVSRVEENLIPKSTQVPTFALPLE